MNINNAIKTIVIFILQVGALWGLLEGYTYFKGDALKEFLGPYWLLIYILPLFTTGYSIFRESRTQGTLQENITTQGDFSPGKVGGNYAVRPQPQAKGKTTPSDESSASAETNTSSTKPSKNIRTKGNHSPGEVGGDYTIEK